jgi:hypothetical protein
MLLDLIELYKLQADHKEKWQDRAEVPKFRIPELPQYVTVWGRAW